MKCPKCGCENQDDYKFCRKCGEPREGVSKGNSSKSNLAEKIKKFYNSLNTKRKVVLGIGIIVVIAIIAMGINSLDIGGIAPGNEAIINVDQDEYTTTSDGLQYVYSISFTLTNAPKEADTYYAKAVWYDKDGGIILSESEALKYYSINDDHTMDVYLTASSKNPENISKCVVEVTNNQGELMASTSYDWLNR